MLCVRSYFKRISVRIVVINIKNSSSSKPIRFAVNPKSTVQQLAQLIIQKLKLPCTPEQLQLVPAERLRSSGLLNGSSTKKLTIYNKGQLIYVQHDLEEEAEDIDFEKSLFLKHIKRHQDAIKVTISYPKPSVEPSKDDCGGIDDNDDEENSQKDSDQEEFIQQFKILSTKEENDQCIIKVEMDRRMTVKSLKTIMKRYVKRGLYRFKVFKQFSSNQLSEISNMNETFQNLPDNGSACLVIQHGRALKENECIIKVFELDMNREDEYFKEPIEIIVELKWSIEKTKKLIAKEFNYSDDVKFRIRQKVWKTVQKIYFDDQSLDDLLIYNHGEVFCEKLMLPHERESNQLSVYLRRFRSSIPKFDKFEEFYINRSDYVNKSSFLDLVQQIKDKYGIENIKFAKPKTQYPHHTSVLDAEDQLNWEEHIESLKAYPYNISEDGSVIFYRDADEETATLSPERKKEIEKEENSKSTCSRNMYTRKEKALKIYATQQ
ncbi:DgyrCDS2415 [Dimorphilus gyrociliatus]|uniref:DgyrCDS2415 n=1 Tax=Dimorphilus gyrociliatus TaxID=2664684 RepID=A0A7I8VD12_9ANNE|nr:DgyrCDS2415 [Dimorphilus gyrociliatus]